MKEDIWNFRQNTKEVMLRGDRGCVSVKLKYFYVALYCRFSYKSMWYMYLQNLKFY